MQLFGIIRNPQFFSLLSSPNREIYAEALFVVYRCYKQEFLIQRDDLVNRMVATLENRMFELAAEEGEEMEDVSLSGRAHWLVRRLLKTGWIELDPLAHTVWHIGMPDGPAVQPQAVASAASPAGAGPDSRLVQAVVEEVLRAMKGSKI